MNIREHFRHTFLALRHPNYRLWFYGQLISLTGTWMQTTAQGYLVYQLTHSAAYLGIVSFANGMPSWIFMLFGGVVADRMSRRQLLIITQSVMMLLAFILVALVVTNTILPWHIVVLSFLLGIANAFDAPTRLAFVSELVDKESLTNAIAINSMMFNGAAIFGPGIAGLVYGWLGASWCFLINGLSFLAVILALLMMKLSKPTRSNSSKSVFGEAKEGLNYALHHDTIRMVLFNLAFVSFFAGGMVALIPAWAVKVMGGDAKLNGLLLSSRGLGAVLGAMIIATLSHRNIKGKLWLIGLSTLPITLFLLTFSPWVTLSVLVMLATGISFMLSVNTSNAIVQSLLEEQLRGRVMSIFSLVFFGFMPLGSLVLGSWAEKWGEHSAVFLSGLMLSLLALFTWIFRPHLKNIP